MRTSAAISALNMSAIDLLRDILDRGQRQGVLRKGLDVVDVHMLISSFCFFRVSNQYTFGPAFDRDLAAPEIRRRHRVLIAEAVVSFLKAQPRLPITGERSGARNMQRPRSRATTR